MRIVKVILQNIKSFRGRTEINFDSKMNIFIGPNGGGKSNLMNTLSWVLNSHFYRPFAFHMESSDKAILQLHNYRESAPEPHWSQPNEPSFVWVEFMATKEDIEGMREYWRNKEKLTRVFEDIVQWDKSAAFKKEDILQDFEKTLVDPDAFGMNAGQMLRYKITIWRDTRPVDIRPVDSLDNNIDSNLLLLYNAYLRYLTDSEMRRTLQQSDSINLPYILYSPIREIGNLDINIAGIQNIYELTRNYHKEMSNFVFNNKGTSQLISQISSIVLASQFVTFIYDGGLERAFSEFNKSKDYKKISGNLNPFGFKWKMEVVHQWSNHFRILISRLGENSYFSVDQASSGERQLINFIFGLSSSAIENSLIIIDEPELNLHPRWQKLLLRFFLGVQRESGAQFIISTHSSSFLNEESLPFVRRIFRLMQASSISEAQKSSEARDIFIETVKYLNAHKNERIFFTEKAVLVEGASDLVIWNKVINTLLDVFSKGEIVEIIEVNGSANFVKYKGLLDLFEMETHIIADLDYAGFIGDAEIKDIFEKYFSDRKASEGLLQSHSIDRAALVTEIERYLDEGERDGLRAIIKYIKTRTKNLNLADFSESDRSVIDDFRIRCESSRTYILSRGSLENYIIDPTQEKGAIKKDSDRAIAFASNDVAFNQWLLKGARMSVGDRLTVTERRLAEESKEFIEIGMRIIGVKMDEQAGRTLRDYLIAVAK